MKVMSPLVAMTVLFPTLLFAQPPVPHRVADAHLLLKAPFTKTEIDAARTLWSKGYGDLKERTSPTTGIKLKLIPPGVYTRGSNDRYGINPPQRITIPAPLFVSETEVTIGQFRKFVEQTGHVTYTELFWKYTITSCWNATWVDTRPKPNYDYQLKVGRVWWESPAYPVTDDHPVVHVSWGDAVLFCRWLSETEGREYRLLTESEWEYVCRAGTETKYPTGDDPETLTEYGNVPDATASSHVKLPAVRDRWIGFLKSDDGYLTSAPVKSYKPNPFGLYDLVGNVCEICADPYADPAYVTTHPEYISGRIPGWWLGTFYRPMTAHNHNWHVLRGSSFRRGWGKGERRSFFQPSDRWFHMDWGTAADTGFRIVEIVDPVGGKLEKPKLKITHEVTATNPATRQVTYTTTLENVSKRTLHDVRLGTNQFAGLRGIDRKAIKVSIDDPSKVIDLTDNSTIVEVKFDIGEFQPGGKITVTHTTELKVDAKSVMSDAFAFGSLKALDNPEQKTEKERATTADVFVSDTARTAGFALKVLLKFQDDPETPARGFPKTRVHVFQNGTKLSTVEGHGGNLSVNALPIGDEDEAAFTLVVSDGSLSGTKLKCISDPDDTPDGRYTVTLTKDRMIPKGKIKFVYRAEQYFSPPRQR